MNWECVVTEPIRERYPLAKELYKRCSEGESALEPLIEYGIDVVAPEIAQVQALQPDGAGLTAEAVLRPLIDLACQRWADMPAGQIILLVLVFSDGATFFGEKPQFARSGFGIASAISVGICSENSAPQSWNGSSLPASGPPRISSLFRSVRG